MSLYLKYRPQDFENLVGQGFIKDTLKKAVSENKTVGAYLFCGPRGTGKTSTARIFAKSINCPNRKDGNPCLTCDICKDFVDERLVDIVEIDAASHTGVDNIREIIERAQFTPTRTEYKIYIIDEVHMLSKGAFNALLKILEEPPKHVKFILATTETHKVPETIISRCQRYDFKRINNKELKSRLEFIAKSENVEVDEKSYDYIIKNSNGGGRNAISLFEQLITDNKILFDEIISKLEIIGEDEINDFLEKLLIKNTEVISDLEKIIGDGKNIKLFFKELLFFAKNKSLEKIKSGENISELLNILEILDETYSKTKTSLDENTTFMIGILRILNGNTVKVVEKKTENNSHLNPLSFQEKGKQINNTIENKKVIKEVEKKEEINHEDVSDIFGGDDAFGETEPVKKDTITDSEISRANFNSGEFIAKLKTSGAKGALTMALRGSTLMIGNNCLNIQPTTKIARSNVENVDNISLMTAALSGIGYDGYTININ